MNYRVILCLSVFAILGGGICFGADESVLFDGKTLDNWTTEDGKAVGAGWEVVRGEIHLNRAAGRAGNIISREAYGDFELTFEWKVAKGGNNGLKYRVRKYGRSMLGLEYQVLDDPNTDEGKIAKRSAGGMYALYAPNAEKVLKPTGKYNHARIVVRGDSIRHWMNGKLIVSATVGDADWKARVGDSKFRDLEGFGENRVGKIMLTDHGAEVWYRNMKLKRLEVGEGE